MTRVAIAEALEPTATLPNFSHDAENPKASASAPGLTRATVCDGLPGLSSLKVKAPICNPAAVGANETDTAQV